MSKRESYLDEVHGLFVKVISLDESRRDSFLAELAGDNKALRREIESLLKHEAESRERFLPLPGEASAEGRPEPRSSAAAREPKGASEAQGEAARHGQKETPTAAYPLSPQIGHYKLLRLIASGGMGAVYEAQQEQPRRRVALKMLRPEVSHSATRARFQLESNVLARLQHPNIAQVYEAGLHTDERGLVIPYFAMELIDGAQTLSEFAAHRDLSIRDRVRLFAKICHAVHYGHQRGVIHRDLKPANILVRNDGEPKIIDFGVARLTDDDVTRATQHTHAGDLIGTVRYMSPEQCDGDPERIDTRSDVYSLGVVLYELLTGQMPYEIHGTTLLSAVRAIKESSIQRPSMQNRALQGDLELVVLKALEKEPAQRYSSAADLGQDLERYLNGEPIEARAPTLTYVLGKYARRNWRQTVSLGLAVAGLIGVLIAIAVSGQLRASRAERDAANRAAVRGLLQSAESSIIEGDSPAARHYLNSITDEKQRESWVWRHLDRRVDQSTETLYEKNTDAIPMAMDLAGRRVATVRTDPSKRLEIRGLDKGDLITIDRDELLAFAATVGMSRKGEDDENSDHGILNVNFDQESKFIALTFSPAESRAAVLIYDVSGTLPKRLCAWVENSAGHGIAISSERVVVGLKKEVSEAREYRWYSADETSPAGKSTLVRTFTVAADNQFQRFVYSPDGNYLAANLIENNAFLIWDLQKPIPKFPLSPDLILEGHTYHVWDIAFSPDANLVASCGMDKRARVWDFERCLEVARESGRTHLLGDEVGADRLEEHSAGIRNISFAPSGDRIITGGDDRFVCIWDRALPVEVAGIAEPRRPHTWTLRNKLFGHTEPLWFVRINNAGLASTIANEGEWKQWEVMNENVARLKGHKTSVNCVAFSPDGRKVYSADGGYTARAWNIDDFSPRWTIQAPFGSDPYFDIVSWQVGQSSFVLTAQGDYMSQRGRLVFMRESESGQPELIQEITHAEGQPLGVCTGLAVSQDGKRIAVGTFQGRVFIFGLNERSHLLEFERSFPAHEFVVHAMTFLDAHGRWLATSAGHNVWRESDGELRIWHTARGARHSLPQSILYDATLFDLVLDSAGEHLAAASSDGDVHLWSVAWADDKPRLHFRSRLQGHLGAVLSVDFGRDQLSGILASVGADGTLRLWDTAAAKEIITLRGPMSRLCDVAISPDGTTIATASAGSGGLENAVLLWETEPFIEKRAARRAHWNDYREAVARAIESCGGLLGTYPQQLKEIAARENWPADVTEIATKNFPAMFDWVKDLIEPAWSIACDANSSEAEYRSALHHAKLLTELSPWSVRAHAVYGALLFRLGDFEHAEQEFDRCDEISGEARAIRAMSGSYATHADEDLLPYEAFQALIAMNEGDHTRATALKECVDSFEPRDVISPEIAAANDMLRREVENAVRTHKKARDAMKK